MTQFFDHRYGNVAKKLPKAKPDRTLEMSPRPNDQPPKAKPNDFEVHG